MSVLVILTVSSAIPPKSAVGVLVGGDLPPGRHGFTHPASARARKPENRMTARDAGKLPAPSATASGAAAATAGAPANDDCTNALAVTDGGTPFSNTGATTDGPDVPQDCNRFGSTAVDSDIWYEYTATCTGNAMVSLCDSLYDTKVAAYTGCGECPPTTDPVACNDDFCGDLPVPDKSWITFPVLGGDCYTLRVGGHGTAQGTGVLSITCETPPPPTGACCDGAFTCVGTMTESACNAVPGTWFQGFDCAASFDCAAPPPSNNDCANAIEVFSGVAYNGSTAGATGIDISSCVVGDAKDVWHTWTADCTGTATFSLCGSAVDTVITVFDSCGGNELACNDAGCIDVGEVALNVTAGQTYVIRVARATLLTGDYTLTVDSCPRACCGGPNTGLCAPVPLSPQECLDFSGVPQAEGTTCGGDEACSLTDGTCVDMDRTCCEGQGGIPGGPGSACETPAPDFDQNQDFDNADGDGDPFTGREAFYGGPTAVADLLWRLDRRFPALSVVPPGVSNTDLIQDLAARMATNAQAVSPFGHTAPFPGTWLDDLEAGVRSYLNSHGLSTWLSVSVEPAPSFSSVTDRLANDDSVALLLGFYHVESVTPIPGTGFSVRWRRTGGHYVAVVDADALNGRVTLSDPDADAAEEGGPGVVLGGDHNHDGDGNSGTHPSFRDGNYDHTKHNVKDLASHDAYDAGPTSSGDPLDPSSIPGGDWLLITGGDPLAYGSQLAPFHMDSSGDGFDLPAPTLLTDAFLISAGYPDPVFCKTYSVVEAAVVIAPKAHQACCLGDGSCRDVSPVLCRAAGYGPQGPGTACLGDGDGSGADDVCEPCPLADIALVVPPAGTLDARQPHAPGRPLPRQGIGAPGRPGSDREAITITLSDPSITGAERCFALCETAADPILDRNAITGVTDLGGGTYEIVLEHAIPAGAVTTIQYKGGGDFIELTSHPSNVDADPTASPTDTTQWVDCCLNSGCGPDFTIHRCDADHSGRIAPPDLLRVIDLLGGGQFFNAWNGTPRPANLSCPPP